MRSLDTCGICRICADDDPGRIEVVIECLGLPQEFRAEQDTVGMELLSHCLRVADRDRRLNHDISTLVHGEDKSDHVLDCRSIKIILLRIVVGRRSHDNEVGVPVRRSAISCRGQVKVFPAKVVFNIFITDRGLSLVDEVNLLRNDIYCRHRVVL